MNIKKWVQLTLLSSIIMIFLMGMTNYIVDPYNIYNHEYFKFKKSCQDNKLRLVKIIKTEEIKPKSICLGTSRALTGLNPKHSYFIQPSYNLATSGSSMYENKLYLMHVIKQGNLKRVLLSLDYIMFNTDKQAKYLDFESYFEKNKFSLIFSIDTLLDSVNTVIAMQDSGILYLENGQRTHDCFQKRVDSLNGHLGLMKKDESIYYKNYSTDYIYQDTKRNSFLDLEDIVKLCYENKIDLDIIFNPSHIRQWEALDYYLSYDKWLQWKKDVVITVNKIAKNYNKSPFRIVDFAIYHQFTAEVIPNNNSKMQYYWESSHYKNALGNIVLDVLEKNGSDKYKGFGVGLYLSNIDQHINEQKVQRNQFIDADNFKYNNKEYLNQKQEK
ncbi:hypothetical protein GJV85_09725 [Sulfurimonas aquatica]|uniref:Uncharacterized protein n=1 Tax=Sulfurimonas aquatica TaxID=2672570 RepID=A0A975B1A2_9BACT|nr:hypothetical protein [Sulfurimonas aquatica]QSZ42372.1 hypothetical protein GJV85_09725 [Sulfurimonas aquatica]